MEDPDPPWNLSGRINLMSSGIHGVGTVDMFINNDKIY
eukprot:gene18205-5771_t